MNGTPHGVLFFLQQVYDLASVLAEIWVDEADMNPVVACLGIFLPDELIKG